ncbi:MAG: ATP-dependent sacrificial sulfur transferase LarE [Deltaproteobacteria bacterium]|nr:ATP-dependent sacrificial sulfur transferase LarE [Deltaproteobacteria bacterium]
MSNVTKSKLETLKKTIVQMDKALIAYSGGVDSTFLLKICLDSLGAENVFPVTVRSPFFPDREFEQARNVVNFLGAKHLIVEHNEFEIEDIVKNTPQRCYYCKKELFIKLLNLAKEFKLKYVLDGTTKDDERDFRPGMKAKRELGIISPLNEAGFTKEEIREISKSMNLPTYNKPSFACLATRFPYGYRITQEAIRIVNEAEEFLIGLGFKSLRVRHYGKLARIEIEKDDIPRFLDPDFRKILVNNFKKLGYVYVTLDLEGLRSGSMNEELHQRG